MVRGEATAAERRKRDYASAQQLYQHQQEVSYSHPPTRPTNFASRRGRVGNNAINSLSSYSLSVMLRAPE